MTPTDDSLSTTRAELTRQNDPEDFARFMRDVVAPAYDLHNVRPEPPAPETMGQGLSGIVAQAGAPRPDSSVGAEFYHDYSTGPSCTLKYSPEAGSAGPCVHTNAAEAYTPARGRSFGSGSK